MNDVKFKYGNIDHLVFRDDGRIFLIETKSHRGDVTTTNGSHLLLNGRPFRPNPMRQACAAARWLRRFLRVRGIRPWISVIIAFPCACVRFNPRVRGPIAVDRQGLMTELLDNFCPQ